MAFALVGASLALAGLAVPTRLGGIERAWMAVEHAISKVSTPIFMGVVYFLMLTPTGLAMRLLGRNRLVNARGGSSAWIRAREAKQRPRTTILGAKRVQKRSAR